MWVAEVRIKDFRGLVDARLSLERETTYLVGENNSGKSSALLAIASATGGRRPQVDDLRHAEDGNPLNEATVDLLIRSVSEEFGEVVAQRLAANYGTGPEFGEWTGIRTRLSYSRETPFLISRRTFLLWNAATEEWEDTGKHVGEKVMEMLAAQLVSASRDLTTDLANRGSDWGRVLADLDVGDEERRDLEGELLGLGQRLQDASPVLDRVRRQLRKVGGAQMGVEEVDIQPLPIRLEELARSVDIVVSRSGASGLPLRFQGLGSRSLAALMVFSALCELRVGIDRGIRPHLLTLLEEPEAHLHPQAQTAIRGLIEELPGQVLVATHSSVLVADAHPRSIRVFRPSAGSSQIHALSIESARKVAVFRRYVERPLGELFFARMVVFVDGTAERISIPVMLEPLLGKNCGGVGVTMIDLEGMNNEQLMKAIGGLEALGNVPWLIFLDSDGSGWHAIEGIVGTDGTALSDMHPQVVASGRKQLEQMLIDAGYEDEIRDVANTYLPFDARDPRFGEPRLPDFDGGAGQSDYLAFLSDNKGWASELVVKKALNRRAMPPPIVELASRIRGELGLSEPTGESYQRAAGLPVSDEDLD